MRWRVHNKETSRAFKKMSGLDQSQHNDSSVNDTDKENINNIDIGGGGTFIDSQTSTDQTGGKGVPLAVWILLGIIFIVVVGAILYAKVYKKEK